MKKKRIVSGIKILLALMAVLFMLFILYFTLPIEVSLHRALFPVVALLAFAFLIFGIILVILALKSNLSKKLKLFLILTGSAAASFLIAVLLHNFVYGIMIILFGEKFWGGGDEAFFFIVALIIAPLMFLVGAIGSTIFLIKRR